MKKLFITSAMSVLFLAASVFAFNETSGTNSCSLKQSTQASATDYSKIVVKGDDNCCQPGADCCNGGACCKMKRNKS